MISSHVARGSVGNRAAVFALEVRGHPVWAVPTITLPFHPGHGPATRIVPKDDLFRALLDDLASSPWTGEVAAVLTGYMTSPSQAEAVADFIGRLRRINPDLLHVCDPVMGDGDRLYIGAETAAAIRDRLVSGADAATPNRFELEWLTGRQADSIASARMAAHALAVPTVLVTSMDGMMRGNIANLLVTSKAAALAEHRRIDNPPNGPGDLIAALFLSHSLGGNTPERALELATASVFEIVAGAARRGSDELMLETDAGSIRKPMAPVQIRRLP